jgi:Rap1a immunity proteins
MHRICQLLVLSGVMIAPLTEIGPASAQSATFRMPGCRSYANPGNVIRYDFSSGVCFGIVETLMSVGPALGICHPPESAVDQGVPLVVQYIDSHPARLHENFNALAIEALRKAWPCSGSR